MSSYICNHGFLLRQGCAFCNVYDDEVFVDDTLLEDELILKYLFEGGENIEENEYIEGDNDVFDYIVR